MTKFRGYFLAERDIMYAECINVSVEYLNQTTFLASAIQFADKSGAGICSEHNIQFFLKIIIHAPYIPCIIRNYSFQKFLVQYL